MTSPLMGARRQTFCLDPARGAGHVSALEWGPSSGRYDVVFLHANGFNAATYAPLLAPLAQGEAQLRVLAADLRGHGLNTLPAKPEANPDVWAMYGQDLLALIRALGEVPRVLAGHSMGGATCLMASLNWPADLGPAPSLVLFDPVVAPQPAQAVNYEDSPLVQGALRRKNAFASPQAAFEAYQGRGAFKTWPDAFLRAYLHDGLLADAEGVLRLSCDPAWEANNFRFPFRGQPEALPQLDMPMTVLRAEFNSTCRWEDWPAQAHIERLDGTTHFLPMERVPQAQQALLHAVQLVQP